MVMVGSMVAVWDGTHFDVRVIPDATSPLGILLQDGVVLVLIASFALLFVWYGIDYAAFGSIQSSPMMRANLMVTYISVPIAGAVWAAFALYRLYEAVAR
jgi:TRAP-type C4-dicarboxylate transport system permease small subunit